MSAVRDDLQIRDHHDDGRYVGEIGGAVVASAFYKVRGTTWIFIHTEVDDGQSGEGIASALVRFALDDVRDQGGRVVPICPFVAAYIRRHPEYEELVDHEAWDGIRSRQEARRRAAGEG